MPPKRPRTSLTKAQLEAGVGADLLALCQAVTADGVLSDAEITALREWLDENRAEELPAIGFLTATIDRILADGVVTPEERRELHTAIEKVLPPEARSHAVAQRKGVESEEKARQRREREEQRQIEREERARNRPVYTLNFMVAGVPYEGRDAVVRRYVVEGDRVFLVRDPHNRYSDNAIEVRIANGMQIGFVPEDYASEVAPFLDAGHPHKAEVAKVIGYRYSIPVVRAAIHQVDSEEPGLTFPEQAPDEQESLSFGDAEPQRRVRGRPVQSKGCAVIALAACVPPAVVAARACGFLS